MLGPDTNEVNLWRVLTVTSLLFLEAGYVLRHVVKHGLDLISKTWTRLVKHGLD